MGYNRLIFRGVCLFIVGAVFSIILNLLQIERQVTKFKQDVLDSTFSTCWWIVPSCGLAATLIGLLYPFFDSIIGQTHKHQREWSSVMRCVAVFVGINHASAKIQFDNNIQLSLSLAAMSLGLWWLFDRSRSGLALGIIIAILATLVTQLLVYSNIILYTEPDFCYIRSCVPSIFFSGGVTMGNIGRQLALVIGKEHKE